MTAPTVIGIDPSITGTGVSTPTGEPVTWRMTAALGDVRLRRIHLMLEDLFDRWDPALVVIEDLPRHANHGMREGGMVQGVIRQQIIAYGYPYLTVPPATLKTYATGKGNATKPDMRMSLFQRFALDLRDDNQVDATWLRLLGQDHLGHPELTLPVTHRRALDKLEPPLLDRPAPARITG